MRKKAVIPADLCIKITKNVTFSTAMQKDARNLLKKLKPTISKNDITEIPLVHERNAKVGNLAVRYLSLEKKEYYTTPTENLSSAYKDWLIDMRVLGWRFFMTRLLFIPPGFEIPLHTDEVEIEGVTKSYRLHHTILGNLKSPMEWVVGNEVVSKQLYEGRNPYLLRVDVPHKAKNNSKRWRIHLVASLISVPLSLKHQLTHSK